MSPEAFTPGEAVHLRADSSRQGAIMSSLPAISGEARYRVFHGPGDIQDYFASQLVAYGDRRFAADGATAIDKMLPVTASEFLARLTAQRLSHPQVDTLYALFAARIKHIPFQFKPLLRLLRADRPRLLIADEVGVGKTIEAGLILKELQARRRLDNVMIVCPKALVAKWRAEMRRFDEDFRPLKAPELRYCLSETHLDGAWPSQYNRAIVHLELVRTEEYLKDAGNSRRPGLFDLDPAPRFDLLIVDEAHHIRNRETQSYDVVRYLSEQSDAAVFLSATPVHIGAQNLYTLLNLLRPDLFLDEAVFASMVEPNAYLTQAMRHVRIRRPADSWQAEAGVALNAAVATSWGSQVLGTDPRFLDWQQRLGDRDPLSDAERVRCLRDLEEVHTLAHVMNRTRRRDIGRFTIREPHTVSVPFTLEQQDFYDALIAFRRAVLSLDHDPRVVRLITDTLERQAASCLPALVPSLDAFIATGRFAAGQVTDDPEESDLSVDLPPEVMELAQVLRELGASMPDEDPKRDRLLEIVRQSMADGEPGKLLIFSFFLHTLDYLHRAIADAGLRVEVVSGRVPDEERERLRDRFRLSREHPDALDVLLSSEVGCEGLDYEFCDRLINYDIPWNPMRIEQRIGRIDRFGQRAEKVQIFNFITPGTVEERVFFRCFDRLGVFRDTVGDLEEVLGDLVVDLNQVAFDPSLTPEQAEERALQMADNAIRFAEEQLRLEEESGGLLGLDQAFVDEVSAVHSEGRYVAPADLRAMVSAYLAKPEIDGRIVADERDTDVFRLRLRKDARAELLAQVRALARSDRPTTELIHWLGGDDPIPPFTFEQQKAAERREMAFVTPIHPLAKVATEYWERQGGPLFAHLLVRSQDLLPGRYVITCDLWETVAIRPDLRLVSVAWDLEGGVVAPEIGAMFLRLVGKAEDPIAPPTFEPASLDQAVARIDEYAYRLRQDALRNLRERNDALVSRKLASLDAWYRHRLDRIEDDLALTDEARIVRMRRAERVRIEHDYQRLVSEIEARRDADITMRRVAVCTLEVRHGE